MSTRGARARPAAFKQSKLKREDACVVFERHSIDLGHSIHQTALPEDRLNIAPSDYFSWSGLHMQCGLSISIHPFFLEFLNYVHLAPLQLSPNFYALLATLHIIFYNQQWDLRTSGFILYFYTLQTSPNNPSDGFKYLKPRLTSHVPDFPKKVTRFTDRWFYIPTRDMDIDSTSFSTSYWRVATAIELEYYANTYAALVLLSSKEREVGFNFHDADMRICGLPEGFQTMSRIGNMFKSSKRKRKEKKAATTVIQKPTPMMERVEDSDEKEDVESHQERIHSGRETGTNGRKFMN